MLELLSSVFQREPGWFLDGNPEIEMPAPASRAGRRAGVPLEPAFLFSKELLQAAIPELLAQTGTTGRQFAHLLIRSHQEMSRNDFPDLERAAESIGERAFPLGVDDLMRLCKQHGLDAALVRPQAGAGARQGPRTAQHGALVLRAAAHHVSSTASCRTIRRA